MPRFVLIFSFVLSASFLFAQAPGDTVSGRLVESGTGEPLEFVDAGLKRASDSSLVANVNTGKDGRFFFTGVMEGTYYVEFNFIGFETLRSVSFTVESGKSTDVGTSRLVIMKSLLDEVEITHTKQLQENSIDRKVYHVDQDIMGKSGSASDVLVNVPSVTVDADGNISLRGSGNLIILINGKPSAMMKVNSATALQQIPASSIERIEVITNPSAKFKPDGAAGIINIVLKKEKRRGFNGLLVGNLSWDRRYNSTLSLNYKPGKVNIFGSYAFRQDYRVRTSSELRDVYDSNSVFLSHYNYSRKSYARPLSHTATLGLTYFINDKSELEISGNYFTSTRARQDNAFTQVRDSDQVTIDSYQRNMDNTDYEWDRELDASFTHRFKKEGHEFSVEVHGADHFEEEINRFAQYYFIPLLPVTYDNTVIKQRERQAEWITGYVLPIDEESELEAGYTWEYLGQEFDFMGEFYNDATDAWITDSVKTNRFNFSQHLHSAYVTYAREMEDFGFMAGLRTEQTMLVTEQVNIDSVSASDYFKLYPTLHLSYTMNDEQAFRLSYSKRVNRPEGDELNPFPEYRDPRNLQAGNPFLKPEQVHSIELGYQYMKQDFSFVPALYYKYTYDAFTEITRYINDTIVLTTNENLGKDQSTGLELIFTWKYKKFLAVTLNANGFYNVIDASALGFPGKKSAFSGNMKSGINLNLTSSTVLQLNLNARSAELKPQGKQLPGFFMNAGLRHDIFQKKASLVVTASDVFNTQRWANEIDTPELYKKEVNKRISRVVYFGFSWRFGGAGKKIKEDLEFDNKM